MIITEESTFEAYYLVFERPVGSKIWTVAFQDNGRVFIAMNRTAANKFAQSIPKLRKSLEGKPYCARVQRILLPSAVDKQPYAEL
jgi:hypothetical protein